MRKRPTFAEMQKRNLENRIQHIADHRLDYVRDPRDFSRNRMLTLSTMLKLILGFTGKTIPKELLDLDDPVTASAFVQQRDKLTMKMFKDLFEHSSESAPCRKRFHGYRLLAVDGSELITPYRVNSSFYNKGSKKRIDGTLGRGFNTVHLNAMYDLLNKIYVDCIIAPHTQLSEQAAAVQLVDAYEGLKAIAIFDRGYPSYNLLEHIFRKSNLEFVMRVANSNSFKAVNSLPMTELDVIIKIHISTFPSRYFKGESDTILSAESPYGKKKKSINWDYGRGDFVQTVRVVRFKLDTGEYETIVTSLMDRKKFPAKVLKELYHLRWGIETSFRELKYNIGVSNLHTIKDEFIIQEIWAKLTMYNFTMSIALSVVLPQMKNRKYAYVVDRSMAITICLRFFKGTGGIDCDNIVAFILQYLQPIRPGRKDERRLRCIQYVPFVYRVAA